MPVQPPNPRASWPSHDDQMVFNLIVIAIGVGVGGYLLWAYYHGQISAAALALRHREMLLLGHFTDTFVDADAEMLRANPYRASVRDLYGISHAIGRFWRIPACVFIGLLALVCMVRAAPSRSKRSFDLDGLVRDQVPSFKMSAAFLGRELSLTPPADGAPLPADYALTGDEWIGRFGSDANCVFYETRARRSLTAQLGPRWAGPESASPAVKLLFVAFALHLTDRREDDIELLGAASAALASGEGNRRSRWSRPAT